MKKFYIADSPERVKRCELLNLNYEQSSADSLSDCFLYKTQKTHDSRRTMRKSLQVHLGNCERAQLQVVQVNGIPDHIHIMSDLHPSISLADYIKNIKVASSLWMKESSLFPQFEGWQSGYGAFTYSIKEKNILIEYIKNQKVHHGLESFYDEYKRLLVENGVQFDERYLW